jgi:chromosome partitioning protein
MDYKNISFSQRTMSEISGISVSSINRYITQNNIDALKINGKIRRYPLTVCRNILHDIKFQDFIPKRKVQVFFNFKGGTGKTSLCFQISSHLAFLGYKVLAIDCDAQGHLSSCFHQLDTNNQGHTIYDVLKGHIPISQSIKSVFEGLDLIPANLSLTQAEVGLSAAHNREKLLSKQLESIKGSYDFIFIDTNPTFSILNFNALLSADDVNVICETQPMSYSGLKILMGQIKTFSKEMDLNISCRIIPNKYEQNTVNAQQILGYLRHSYSDLVSLHIIRKCEDFNECSKSGTPFCLKYYHNNSQALEDILDLLHELIEKNCERKIKNKAA